MSELEDLLAEEKDTPAPASQEPIEKEPIVEETKSPEEVKKEEHLANINKAIAEANEELRKKRKQVKEPVIEEDELPKIDMKDPSAKAWDKHISEKVNPLSAENDKEKDEVRDYALQTFLSDKPSLAKSPEKLKSVMETYYRLSEGKISGKTFEGVITYLEKAYAAESKDEILAQQRRDRVARAQADAVFSDPAVSRGSTSYSSERESTPTYNEEAKAILAKWNMTPQEHAELVKKQKAAKQ